jgi:hypothetical protein
MKIFFSTFTKAINRNKLLHFSKKILSDTTCLHSTTKRCLNIGGKTSSNTLLLSPAEASKILRTNESTVDLEAKSSIKYYDINYLGANNPPEDRQAQAKCLNSDVYLFGVFDGHGGNISESVAYSLNLH